MSADHAGRRPGRHHERARKPRTWPQLAFMVVTISVASSASLILVSIEDALRWRPLPASVKTDGLVHVGATRREDSGRQALTPLDVAALEDHAPGLAGVAGVMPTPCVLNDHERTFRARCAYVSASFWQVLGVALERPIMPFRATDRVRPAIVSPRFWRTALGSRADVRGLSLTMKDVDVATLASVRRSVPVVGMAPEEFHTPGDTDVWIAAVPVHDGNVAVLSSFEIWGRLQPQMSADAVRPQLVRALQLTRGGDPGPQDQLDVMVRPLTEALIPDDGHGITLLLATAIALLIVAWVATGTLLSAMTMAQQREDGIRVALGAAPWLLLRPSAMRLLGIGAAALGASVLLARWGLTVLAASLPLMEGRYVTLRPSGLFIAASFTLCGVCACGAIAWRAARRAEQSHILGHALAAGRELAPGPRRARRTAFGVTMVIVTASLYLAAILVLAFVRLYTRQLGFDVRHLAVMSVLLPWQENRSAAEAGLFYQEALRRVRALPTVREASIMSTGGFLSGARAYVPVREPRRGAVTVAQEYRIAPAFCRTMGIRIRVGRAEASEKEFLVNERLASELSGNPEGAIGQRLEVGGTSGVIVGVVTNMRDQDLRTPPVAQVFHRGEGTTFVLRTVGPPAPALADVAAAIRSVRADARVSAGSSYEQRLWLLTRVERVRAAVMTAFSGVALLIGLAALWAHARHVVLSEWRAVAIVRAIGAGSFRVWRYVFGPVFLAAAIGVGGGMGVGIVAARLVAAYVVDIRAWEPLAAAWAGGTIVGGIILVLMACSIRLVRAEPAQMLMER